jgi:hypothetical protein
MSKQLHPLPVSGDLFMKRLLSSLFAAALLATLGTPAFATATAAPMHMSMMGMHKHTCAMGSTWVKGYLKKDGTKVKGYCRKSKM